MRYRWTGKPVTVGRLAIGLWAVLLGCGVALGAEEETPAAADPPEPPDLVVPTETFPAEPLRSDEACLQELRRCCCPSWTHYAIFDVLFLQRDNQVGDRPIVLDNATLPPSTVMTTQDLQPGMATGTRVFYGSLFSDAWGWEVGYLGIYGMFGDAVATGDDTLQLPPDLNSAVSNFGDADRVRGTYRSTLNMAEFNFFRYDCCSECGPRCRHSCHCINWLAGFVWAGLDEQAGLAATCCDPPETSRYDVRTSTNFFGPQIGMRGRREWCRWAVEGWWKTAVCGTAASQSQDPIVDSLSGQTVRPAEASTAGAVGFIGSLNGTLVYRLTDVWGLRAGYNLIWLTNTAMAPTQWDFATSDGAGSGINDNGGIFLHGLNLGVEARW